MSDIKTVLTDEEVRTLLNQAAKFNWSDEIFVREIEAAAFAANSAQEGLLNCEDICSVCSGNGCPDCNGTGGITSNINNAPLCKENALSLTYAASNVKKMENT